MKLSFTGFNVALVLLLVPGIARAENPDLMTLIGASSRGEGLAARDNSGNDQNDNASTYGLSSSDHNSFAVDYGNSGVVRGHGRCSTRAGTDPWNWDGDYEIYPENFVENLTDETGQSVAQYCYCGFDSYTPLNGTATALSGPWFFNEDYGDDEIYCADNCAWGCAADLLSDNESSLVFRAAMFNAYAPSSSASGDAITTQTYVDNALNTKQAKITTTGTNKLMTYGASTGATPGSRDIVSTLGTSTTATTVPETGPIVSGIANKQDIVNGTADYVMTGTGTAGTVGEKPVYSTTNNYSNALVTAQTVNTAAANAANGEMSCHTYVSGQSQTPANCLLWQIVQSAPTGLALASTNPDLMTLIGASSAGSEYAARDNNGEDINDNASTYGLSSSDRNSFADDYGNSGVVRGHGRCSTRAGDSGTWDNDTYNVISGNFVDSLTDETGQSGAQYCYCGLDSYTPLNDTATALSGPWVFHDDEGSVVSCADGCAYLCAGSLVGDDAVSLAIRSAVFNAYE